MVGRGVGRNCGARFDGVDSTQIGDQPPTGGGVSRPRQTNRSKVRPVMSSALIVAHANDASEHADHANESPATAPHDLSRFGRPVYRAADITRLEIETDQADNAKPQAASHCVMPSP